MGYGEGRPHTRPEDAEREFPGCLCASQGHPDDITCREYVGGGRGTTTHPCGKPSKATVEEHRRTDDGLMAFDLSVCGTHKRARERIAATRQREAETRAASESALQRGMELGRSADDVVEQLAALGITSRRDVNGGVPTGDVVVDGEALAALLRRYRHVNGDFTDGDSSEGS